MHIAQGLCLSKSYVHRILSKGLMFHPYKIQQVHALLKPDDVLFSDKAYLYLNFLNEAVNKLNCHYTMAILERSTNN